MKKLIVFLFFLPFLSLAQTSDHFVAGQRTGTKKAPNTKSTEIGGFAGVSYYNGEANLSKQFPAGLTHPAVGLVLRRNVNSRWAFRLNGLWGKVLGNDLLGTTNIQKRRSTSFSSHIYEVSGIYEFNFMPYCASNQQLYFSPYIFAGLGGFYFNPKSHITGTEVNLAQNSAENASYSQVALCLPFGIGTKIKLNHRFLFSLEWGARKTWTDYIDDVSTVYASEVPAGKFQRGNSKNKDFYTFSGATLTMRIGGKPTSCERFGNRQQ